MIKFEKRYLYTFADVEQAKSLIGKKGIHFDEKITDINLCNDELTLLTEVLDDRFLSYRCGKESEPFRFFYYDPNLEAKRAYYLKGKKIQWKDAFSKYWKDCDDEPYWSDTTEYRVKSYKYYKCTLLTNRQVAEWLAKGYGQLLFNDIAVTHYNYKNGDDDKPFPYLIRKWVHSEWHVANVDYIDEDD